MANNPQEMDEKSLSKISKIVDAPFIEKILRDAEKDSSIRILNISIRFATNKGDNFTSDMYRVSVEYTRNDENGRICNEKRTLIVKAEIMTEGIHKDLVSNSTLFSTEISMMTDTLVQMNELLGPDSPPLNGRGLYAQRQNPSLLVIEDLISLGFRMADRQVGLDMDHCLLAIRNLARFHASSVALFERDPSQKSRYIHGLFDKCQPPELHTFFIDGAKQLVQEIENWPELEPEIPKKILKLADKINEKACEVTARRENEFNVLNHGDFWVNNMLFKYNELNQPIGHIFVDFQLCQYSSPAIDLIYFFNTSLTEDTLILNEETLLHEYIRTLALAMRQVNCTMKPPSLEQVKVMMRERAVYAVIASINILPMALADRGEITDINEMLAKENKGYKGKLYRKAMLKRLPKFNQMGLLD